MTDVITAARQGGTTLDELHGRPRAAEKQKASQSKKACLHCVSVQSTSGRPADSAFPWQGPKSVRITERDRKRTEGWTVKQSIAFKLLFDIKDKFCNVQFIPS